jgi:ankyrin repeat protein
MSTFFNLACFEGNMEKVSQMLADETTDVTSIDDTGSGTGLNLACRLGHLEIVQLLLSHHRIDPTRVNTHGDNALHIACESNESEILEILLKDPRFDPNQLNADGETPFYLACNYDNYHCIELLLEDPRIDVNLPNPKGETPFYALCGGCEYFGIHEEEEFYKLCRDYEDYRDRDETSSRARTVKIIISNPRINICQTNNVGQTPFYIACKNGYVEVLKVLFHNITITLHEKEINGYQKAFDAACKNNSYYIAEYMLENVSDLIISTIEFKWDKINELMSEWINLRLHQQQRNKIFGQN